jgi:hypothetical protein
MPQESFSQGVRMKGALRSYWRALFGNRTEKKLRDGLEKLSNCCQAPDPKAKGA